MKDKILEQLNQLDIQFRPVGKRDGENFIAYKDETAEAIEKMFKEMNCSNCNKKSYAYFRNDKPMQGCVYHHFELNPRLMPVLKCNDWEAKDER